MQEKRKVFVSASRYLKNYMLIWEVNMVQSNVNICKTSHTDKFRKKDIDLNDFEHDSEK